MVTEMVNMNENLYVKVTTIPERYKLTKSINETLVLPCNDDLN